MSKLSNALCTAARAPLVAYRAVRWRTGHWLPRHLLRHRPFHLRRLPRGTTVDVLVTLVDHFEPVRALRQPSDQANGVAAEAVARWCRDYERLAGRCRDADGRGPQYSWFFAADFPDFGALQHLSDAAFRGLGEVEFHLHHGHDTEASFAKLLADGLDWFNAAGAMVTAERSPRRRFGYIAGNWSLDNGAGDDSTSGCNTEIGALRRAGCYADFTFPAVGSCAQPRMTNTIYYATDCPRPKSYDWGTDVEVGKPASGDLILCQGPLLIDWRTGKFEDGALERHCPPAPERLDPWLRANVHVRGRPEWVFVKLFTHGIQHQDVVLGPPMEATLAAMVERWNRPPFRLHFVTAREAYNLVKAAEAGCSGDPNNYRDFEIPPPANRRVRCESAWRLRTYTADHVGLDLMATGATRVDFSDRSLRRIEGALRTVDAYFNAGRLERLDLEGDGPLQIELAPVAAGMPPRRVATQRGTWINDSLACHC
jgi:hypothetical protein